MTLTSVLAPDGNPIKLIRLEHDCGTQLTLMDWGGTWLSCMVPLADGSRREVLLGCDNLADYFCQSAFLGATIGRYANRIGHSRIQHAGKTYSLTPFPGPHQLHGGPEGFDKRRWAILEQSREHVCLGLHSPTGDQGFPGNLAARVTYRLLADTGIAMEYVAEVDVPCPVNLTQHAYFNLDGTTGDIRQHQLQINAARYAPIDADSIPTGELAPVAGTSFDFRQAKPISRDFLQDAQQQLAGGYDHAWLLDAACHDLSQAAATLTSADGGLTMDIFTSKPSIQFYSGNYLAGQPGRGGVNYAAHQGLALETQFLPDSPNHPEWPQASCWLQPGETYRHSTTLLFRS